MWLLLGRYIIIIHETILEIQRLNDELIYTVL